MNPLATLLARRRAVVFDGALATELERRGHDLSSRLWSARLIADAPEAIVDVHLDHLRAGADVISTASYQASRFGFERAGLTAAHADAQLERAVELARQAVTRHGAPGRLVAASLGPWGAVLADGSEFTGDYTLSVAELVDFQRPRVDAVLAGSPDLVLFETLPSLAEAEMVARIAECFPDVPFLASFSAKQGTLCHGEPFAEVLRVLEGSPNVLGVGLNCSAPEAIAPMLASVKPARLLLGASPNAGETWDAVSRAWRGTPTRSDDFAVLVRSYLEAGARIVGGCCRTRPEDIAVARRVIDAF